MSEQNKPTQGPLTPQNGGERREGRMQSSPPPQRRNEGEIIFVDAGTRLSPQQCRLANDLRRLYQSLGGGHPGQYWPQALLDTAGGFRRLAFPDTGPSYDTPAPNGGQSPFSERGES
jgi:hypothetical protein